MIKPSDMINIPIPIATTPQNSILNKDGTMILFDFIIVKPMKIAINTIAATNHIKTNAALNPA